jgi:hypothetical protein
MSFPRTSIDIIFPASAGNVCTVRCRNNALAGPFGGCFPVQQTDVTPKDNRPDNIETAQALDATLAQVASNQKDLPAAIQANANAGSDEAKQNLAAVEAILNIAPTTSAFPQQTPPLTPPGGADAGAGAGAGDAASSSVSATAEATATPTADAGNNAGNGGNGNGNGNNRGNGNGNGNGNGRGNANADAGAATGRNGGANANDGAATGRNGGAGAGNGGNGGNGRNNGNQQDNQGNNNQRRSKLRWANRLA